VITVEAPPPDHVPPMPFAVKLSTPDVPEPWKHAQAICDFIEVVYLRDLGSDWRLAAYVNENGIAEGLPLNLILENNTPIFGPVVIVRERVDEEGETRYADLTPADMEILETFRLPVTNVIQREGPG
jgi:hypothetical protein